MGHVRLCEGPPDDPTNQQVRAHEFSPWKQRFDTACMADCRDSQFPGKFQYYRNHGHKICTASQLAIHDMCVQDIGCHRLIPSDQDPRDTTNSPPLRPPFGELHETQCGGHCENIVAAKLNWYLSHGYDRCAGAMYAIKDTINEPNSCPGLPAGVPALDGYKHNPYKLWYNTHCMHWCKAIAESKRNFYLGHNWACQNAVVHAIHDPVREQAACFRLPHDPMDNSLTTHQSGDWKSVADSL